MTAQRSEAVPRPADRLQTSVHRDSTAEITWTHTHTHTRRFNGYFLREYDHVYSHENGRYKTEDRIQRPFYGPLSRTTRVSRYQKKHSSTHHPDHQLIFISFFHLPRSTASSLFKLRAWQSFCTTSFHVLFGGQNNQYKKYQHRIISIKNISLYSTVYWAVSHNWLQNISLTSWAATQYCITITCMHTHTHVELEILQTGSEW